MKTLPKLLVLFLLLSFFTPTNVSASEQAQQEKLCFSDGSYILVEITSVQARASGGITGSQHYTYYNSNDVRQWRATVTGTFTYDGTTSTCTAVSTSFTAYVSGWNLDSVSKYKSGNKAIGDFYLSYSAWETSVRVTLTCDKNGKLS